ncbi:MAG: hypothetical protein M3457_22155, partial [Chloroflexota bacterium]|nr:hypothetical protein [Chloroflexota bacterium]
MTQQDNRTEDLDTDEHEPADQGSTAQINPHLGPGTATGVAPAGTMRAGEAGSVADTDDSEWT